MLNDFDLENLAENLISDLHIVDGNALDKEDLESIANTIDNKYGFDILGLGDSALSMHIVDSDMKRQKLEYCFEQAVNQGYVPNEVQGYIYEQTGITPDQLTDIDRERLVNYVASL